MKTLLLANEIAAASAEQTALCNAIEIASESASPRYVRAKYEHLNILRRFQLPGDLESLAREVCDQTRLLKMRELALYSGAYARLLEAQAKHHEAFVLRREKYKVYTEDVGPEARITLASLSSLAWSAYSTGRIILSITLFEQATKRYAEVYGPNDRETAEVWHDFETILQKTGNSNGQVQIRGSLQDLGVLSISSMLTGLMLCIGYSQGTSQKHRDHHSISIG